MSFLKSAANRLGNLGHRLFRLNPVIVKEMRARIRGPRAFWILTGYLTLLGLLVYGLYRIVLVTMQGGFGMGAPPQSAAIGQTLFIGLVFMELMFVCFITPALTGGTISGEVERRTYDMLLATPLRPVSILMGKVVASLTYVNLLILAAIPLSSIIFLFGGVVLRDVVQAIGFMVVVAITYGTIGVFFSALTRRTAWATVLSYVAVLILTFGTLFMWGVLTAVGRGRYAPVGILYLNPLTAMASAVLESRNAMGGGISTLELFRLFTLGDYVFQEPVRPLWQYTVALYLSLTAILCVLTTQLVRPVRRWRFDRRSLISLGLLLLLLACGLVVIFATDFGTTGWRNPDGRDATPTPVPGPDFSTMPVRVPVVTERKVVVEVQEEGPDDGAGEEESPSPSPTSPPTPTPVERHIDLEEAGP